jgi:hypothetical protein
MLGSKARRFAQSGVRMIPNNVEILSLEEAGRQGTAGSGAPTISLMAGGPVSQRRPRRYK